MNFLEQFWPIIDLFKTILKVLYLLFAVPWTLSPTPPPPPYPPASEFIQTVFSDLPNSFSFWGFGGIFISKIETHIWFTYYDRVSYIDFFKFMRGIVKEFCNDERKQAETKQLFPEEQFEVFRIMFLCHYFLTRCLL